jgi:hypothetical protein
LLKFSWVFSNGCRHSVALTFLNVTVGFDGC